MMNVDEERDFSYSLQPAAASGSGSPESSLFCGHRASLLVVVGSYCLDMAEECLFDILARPTRINSSFLERSPKPLSGFSVPGGPHRASDIDPQFTNLFARPPPPSFVEVLEFIRGWRFRNRSLPAGPAQH